MPSGRSEINILPSFYQGTAQAVLALAVSPLIPPHVLVSCVRGVPRQRQTATAHLLAPEHRGIGQVPCVGAEVTDHEKWYLSALVVDVSRRL